MKFKNLKLKAFTLLEILLYLSLFVIVVGGVVSFTYTMIGVKLKTKTISTVNDEADHVINLMTQTIHNAQTIDLPTGNVSNGHLLIETSDTPNSPVEFNLISGQILMSEGKNKPISLTSKFVKVTDLNFTNVSVANFKNLIKVSFRLSANNVSPRYEFNYDKIYEAYASTRN